MPPAYRLLRPLKLPLRPSEIIESQDSCLTPCPLSVCIYEIPEIYFTIADFCRYLKFAGINNEQNFIKIGIGMETSSCFCSIRDSTTFDLLAT